MSIFSQAIRESVTQIIGEPWGDGPNPLIIMGFTEAILDLGLDEQALHACVNSYARQLSAQVHPDKVGQNSSVDRQKEIIDAFDRLKDLDTFRECLRDFRGKRAEDRRELSIVRKQLMDLKSRGMSTERQYAALTEYRNRTEEQLQHKLRAIEMEQEKLLAASKNIGKDAFEYALGIRRVVKGQARTRLRIIRQREGKLARLEIELNNRRKGLKREIAAAKKELEDKLKKSRAHVKKLVKRNKLLLEVIKRDRARV